MEDIEVNVRGGGVRKYKRPVSNEAVLKTLKEAYGVGNLEGSDGFDVTYSGEFLDAGLYTYVPITSSDAGEGSFLKRRRVEEETPAHWQAFVQSAAKHYSEWEADVEKDSAMKFLTVSGDPLLNFPEGYLLGIRDCYMDLKKILEDSEAGRRFIVLGTSGIGKSLFSAFWVCHQAAKKKKIVWKLHDQFNLLDFSDDGKVDAHLDKYDPKIQEVFGDGDAWLILDGGQAGGIDCACHVLVPCSDQKRNYVEFGKGQLTSRLYLPVWEEEEIIQFLDAFEKHRLEYARMCVPSKAQAMDNYALLGGVARKRVCKDGRRAKSPEELDRLKLSKLRCHRFESLETLPKLEADTYYYPKAGNFASIDAIVYPNRLLQFFNYSPNRLLQFFNYSRGNHGYLVTGLEKVHAQLKQDKYEIWSCVPKAKYEGTGFQQWLNSGGVKYKQPLPPFLVKSEQHVIEVDYEKLAT